MNTSKRTENDFYVLAPGSNIRIAIDDGELSIVAHMGTKPQYTHNIKEHPNWDHVVDMFDRIYEYDKKEFLNIVKQLKKDSQGYESVKAFAENKITECDSKISEIMKEADFWKSF